MVGNDVVDLHLAAKQSNWQRKGFLEKLFTAQELALVENAADPHFMVWLLWSMKEAAYKAYNRQTGERGFFPMRLVCTDISTTVGKFRGIVSCGGFTYATFTTAEDGIIHTVATCKGTGVQRTGGASACSKDACGLPYVLAHGCRLPASRSHHGRADKTVVLY